MDPVEFHFNKRAIMWRMAISGVVTALALVAIALFEGPSSYWMVPLFWILAGIHGYRSVRDVFLLVNAAPAIVVENEGIRDATLGNALIPWAAIRSIKATRSRKALGGALFLIAERSMIGSSPGPVAVRAANLVIGMLRRPESEQMALAMTPFVILDATQDNVLEAIEARGQGSEIPVEWVG